jgi:hypothetical protein
MNTTPIRELIKLESDLTNMFDSDARIAMAILNHIRSNKKQLIEQDRNVILTAFSRGYDYCYERDLEEQGDDFEYDYYETNFEK